MRFSQKVNKLDEPEDMRKFLDEEGGGDEKGEIDWEKYVSSTKSEKSKTRTGSVKTSSKTNKSSTLKRDDYKKPEYGESYGAPKTNMTSSVKSGSKKSSEKKEEVSNEYGFEEVYRDKYVSSLRTLFSLKVHKFVLQLKENKIT